MADPEIFIIKGGAIVLLVLVVCRLVWQEFNDLRKEVRRKVRQR